MACDTIRDTERNRSCLYCNTTDHAFGPIFWGADSADEFMIWLECDPRAISMDELEEKRMEWLRETDPDYR